LKESRTTPLEIGLKRVQVCSHEKMTVGREWRGPDASDVDCEIEVGTNEKSSIGARQGSGMLADEKAA
jgi:hypothetical protein